MPHVNEKKMFTWQKNEMSWPAEYHESMVNLLTH